jgi:quercetin dioxygenase-like cupin family protein
MMMNRFVLVAAFTTLLAVSAVWTGRAQQAAEGGVPPRITGTSAAMDAKDLTIARRRFEAGARTFWHSHPRGQLLLVEQGRMRLQKTGQAVREFGPGEADYTAPNVRHWHGAAAGEALVQVNAGFGGVTTWADEVTADEYAGKKK